MPSATPWIQRLWDEVEFSSRESSKIQESAVDKVRDEVTRGIRSFLLNSIKSVPTIILLRIQRSKPRLEHRSRTLSHSDNVSRSEWGSHMPVRRYSIFPIRFLLESVENPCFCNPRFSLQHATACASAVNPSSSLSVESRLRYSRPSAGLFCARIGRRWTRPSPTSPPPDSLATLSHL